jgi:uncharacterized membrane protein
LAALAVPGSASPHAKIMAWKINIQVAIRRPIVVVPLLDGGVVISVSVAPSFAKSNSLFLPPCIP